MFICWLRCTGRVPQFPNRNQQQCGKKKWQKRARGKNTFLELGFYRRGRSIWEPVLGLVWTRSPSSRGLLQQVYCRKERETQANLPALKDFQVFCNIFCCYDHTFTKSRVLFCFLNKDKRNVIFFCSLLVLVSHVSTAQFPRGFAKSWQIIFKNALKLSLCYFFCSFFCENEAFFCMLPCSAISAPCFGRPGMKPRCSHVARDDHLVGTHPSEQCQNKLTSSFKGISTPQLFVLQIHVKY